MSPFDIGGRQERRYDVPGIVSAASFEAATNPFLVDIVTHVRSMLPALPTFNGVVLFNRRATGSICVTHVTLQHKTYLSFDVRIL